ncbi:hypothetical protein CKO_03067 [Citrobacter koseri ATCC BAA-895]|uniref:Uncharacterized protein n=1 Tax=Citrobacter koseri (strain ATCC BAA-895 / CDC 4225-83 / SGSC4696) TaxID=290338 RepID=A8AKZ5_CITK8|nr:hypothetical protein CKO_03067 [Citrobacter koseri ATCC BAA-895]
MALRLSGLQSASFMSGNAIKKAPYGAFFDHSISSGSSERIIPVLSA